tara:strand:+ start:165 stop:374 length:210 start_codon:yes stop_codon:yes gene_type:complete
MPILAALDECLAAFVEISNHANSGLEDPSKQRDALLQIKGSCNEIDEIIRGIFDGLPEGVGPPVGGLLN